MPFLFNELRPGKYSRSWSNRKPGSHRMEKENKSRFGHDFLLRRNKTLFGSGNVLGNFTWSCTKSYLFNVYDLEYSGSVRCILSLHYVCCSPAHITTETVICSKSFRKYFHIRYQLLVDSTLIKKSRAFQWLCSV